MRLPSSGAHNSSLGAIEQARRADATERRCAGCALRTRRSRAVMAGELILIVEDNEKNRKLERDILQFHGYQTVEADTAEEGIRLAQAAPPALVLIDIQLPGMNGIEALQQLRADARTRAIPVIAVTASVMDRDRQKIIAAGVRRLPGQADRGHAVRRGGTPCGWSCRNREPAVMVTMCHPPMACRQSPDRAAARSRESGRLLAGVPSIPTSTPVGDHADPRSV
jgi:two-component system, cell cycle response regulator DivK